MRGRGSIAVVASTVVVLVVAGGVAHANSKTERAAELFRAQEHERAYALLCELAAEGSRSPEVFHLKGVIERTNGDLALATRSLARGLRLAPDRVDLVVDLAVAHSWTGELQRALELYDRALAIDPDHRGAVLGRARTLAWRGDLGQARAVYRRLLEEDPTDSAAANGLAFVERADRHYARARALYRGVLAQSPNDTEARDGLAAIRDARQWRASASVGTALVADRTQMSGGASLSYDGSARWSLNGAYSMFVPVGALEVVDDVEVRRLAHRAAVGLVLRPNQKTAAVVTATATAQAGLRSGGLGLDGERRVGERLSVLGGVRGIATAEGLATVASTGVSLSLSETAGLQGQYFAARSAQGRWSHVGVAGVRTRLPFDLAARATASLGTGQWSANASLSRRLTAGFAVSVEVGHFRGAFAQTNAGLSFATSF